MKITVVGLGKIGLPLSAQFLSKGHEVFGCDINRGLVEKINKGENPLKEEPGISDILKKHKLKASTDTTACVKESDVVVVIVPLITKENNELDYGPIKSATEAVGKGLQKGSLVVYETTLPVGDTRNVLTPILEKESGLKAGEFFVAFSPERVASGRILHDLKTYPKIVSGINEESTNKAVEFYKKVLDADVYPVKNTETAEMIKLAGMVYRDTNIALANEFAKFAHKNNIDIQEVIEGSNTNPHSHILSPGCGVGGHCAPVYPYFLIKKAKDTGLELKIPTIARKINDRMPQYTVDLLKENLQTLKNKIILVLGLAFRAGVKELAFSPSVKIIELLKKEQANVFVYDKMFTKEEIERFGLYLDKIQDIEKLDGIILTTAEEEFKEINFGKLKENGLQVIIDGKNFLDLDIIKQFDINYIGIGKK